MKIIRSLAPACYGSAIMYPQANATCDACPFIESCRPLSLERLERFRAALPLPAPKPEKTKTAPKPKKASKATSEIVIPPTAPALPLAAGLADLPVKVRAIVQRLQERGIDLAAALRRGINPVDDKPAFLRLTCDALLSGPLDRAMLRTSFMEAFEWNYGTASSHVGQIFKLMPGIGAAHEIGGSLILERN